MKNKFLISAFFVLVLGAVAWGVLRGQKINKEVPPVTTEEKKPQNNPINFETITLSSEKPVSFEGVEMTTYKSSSGYEITYPKGWISVLAPKGTNPYLENYAIYPKDIPYGPAPIIDISINKKTLNQIFSDLGIEQTTLQKVLVNNITGYKYQAKNHPSVSYFFEINDYTYRIVYWYSPEYGVSEKEALFVLSTFKITE